MQIRKRIEQEIKKHQAYIDKLFSDPQKPPDFPHVLAERISTLKDVLKWIDNDSTI